MKCRTWDVSGGCLDLGSFSMAEGLEDLWRATYDGST